MSRPRTAKRVIRDCEHPQANHEHGTLVAYNLDRCRCHPCTDAASAWRNEHNHSGTRLVPADKVRAHIGRCLALGLSVCALAELSGVSRTGIDRLASGVSRKVRPASERALLSIDVLALIESGELSVRVSDTGDITLRRTMTSC